MALMALPSSPLGRGFIFGSMVLFLLLGPLVSVSFCVIPFEMASFADLFVCTLCSIFHAVPILSVSNLGVD